MAEYENQLWSGETGSENLKCWTNKKSWKRIIQKMYSVAKHTLGTREQEATMSKVGLMWQLLVTNSDILLKICQLDSIHLFWSKNWVATADKNYSKLMSWNWNWTLILFDWGTKLPSAGKISNPVFASKSAKNKEYLNDGRIRSLIAIRLLYDSIDWTISYRNLSI